MATTNGHAAKEVNRAPALVVQSEGSSSATARSSNATGRSFSAVPYGSGSAEPTAALVAAVEEARAKLRARRDQLRAELESAERALSAREIPKAPSPIRTTSPASTRARVLDFVRKHPGLGTGAIAKGIGEPGGRVGAVLFALRKRGALRTSGPRMAQLWSSTGLSGRTATHPKSLDFSETA